MTNWSKKFRRDKYHRRAKQQGFLARAAYKLEAIDKKFELVKPGYTILDLGCNPGSWLQYCHTKTKGNGAFVGVDRTPPKDALPFADLIAQDVFELPVDELLAKHTAFDLVLSDMAPDTTGIRRLDQDRSEALLDRALDIASQVLRPGGHFVGKIFQGAGFQDMIARCRKDFTKTKTVKPDASRKQSSEQYIIGIDKLP